MSRALSTALDCHCGSSLPKQRSIREEDTSKKQATGMLLYRIT